MPFQPNRKGLAAASRDVGRLIVFGQRSQDV